MAVLPRPSTPAGAWRDLRAFLATRQRHQLLAAAVAVLMPTLILIGFYIDSDPGKPPAQIIYVQNYNGYRPDSVIKAQQKIDEAEKQKALAERQAAYKRLADQLGIR